MPRDTTWMSNTESISNCNPLKWSIFPFSYIHFQPECVLLSMFQTYLETTRLGLHVYIVSIIGEIRIFGFKIVIIAHKPNFFKSYLSICSIFNYYMINMWQRSIFEPVYLNNNPRLINPKCNDSCNTSNGSYTTKDSYKNIHTKPIISQKSALITMTDCYVKL